MGCVQDEDQSVKVVLENGVEVFGLSGSNGQKELCVRQIAVCLFTNG